MAASWKPIPVSDHISTMRQLLPKVLLASIDRNFYLSQASNRKTAKDENKNDGMLLRHVDCSKSAADLPKTYIPRCICGPRENFER